MNFISQTQETFSSRDLLQFLNRLLITEVNTIEILVYQEELVERLSDCLSSQQKEVDNFIETTDEEGYFTVTLYQMDIERVKYSLNRYIRARLLKIEKNLEYITSNPDQMDRLSTNEKYFASKLNNLNNDYFEDNVTKKFSAKPAKEYYQKQNNRFLHATTNTKNFVFCRFATDIPDVEIDTEHNVNMKTGDIAIIQYKAIQNYVLENMVDIL